MRPYHATTAGWREWMSCTRPATRWIARSPCLVTGVSPSSLSNRGTPSSRTQERSADSNPLGMTQSGASNRTSFGLGARTRMKASTHRCSGDNSRISSRAYRDSPARSRSSFNPLPTIVPASCPNRSTISSRTNSLSASAVGCGTRASPGSFRNAKATTLRRCWPDCSLISARERPRFGSTIPM